MGAGRPWNLWRKGVLCGRPRPPRALWTQKRRAGSRWGTSTWRSPAREGERRGRGRAGEWRRRWILCGGCRRGRRRRRCLRSSPSSLTTLTISSPKSTSLCRFVRLLSLSLSLALYFCFQRSEEIFGRHRWFLSFLLLFPARLDCSSSMFRRLGILCGGMGRTDGAGPLRRGVRQGVHTLRIQQRRRFLQVKPVNEEREGAGWIHLIFFVAVFFLTFLMKLWW